MKSIYKFLVVLMVTGLGFTSCELDPISNPNAPTSDGLLNGASLADLQLLTSGLESVIRNDMSFYYNTVSIVGREYYDLSGTDPRYTGELLGASGAQLDNNGFLTTRAFAQVYRVARNANNLITAVDNSSTDLTDAEKASIKGVAKTYKAYSLLLELNRQYQNGIRVDVADENNPGPFLSYGDSLAALRQLIDDAATDLNGVSSFPVVVQNEQFATIGGATPQNFLKFNQAIGARIAMYQEDKPAMQSYLANSFIDEMGSLYDGVYHVFGQGGNDISNPLAVIPQTTLTLATDSFINSAEAGDQRVAMKTTPLIPTPDLSVPVLLNGLSASNQVALYTSFSDAVPMIRNEELILMLAESYIGNNNPEAARLLNIIRNAAGLGNTSASSTADLTDELLMQRRYSLFGEGHYWVDMRRYNRLGDIPIERAGDVVHTQFPRPVLETD